MSEHNLTDRRFGHWTVIEDISEKDHGRKMIVCKCDCGTVKRMTKSPFLNGHNSEKCFECHLKKQKSFPMARKRMEY